MKTSWTEKKILDIASRTKLMVPIYTVKDTKLRKLTRRMCKDGKLVMVFASTANFFYRTPK